MGDGWDFPLWEWSWIYCCVSFTWTHLLFPLVSTELNLGSLLVPDPRFR